MGALNSIFTRHTIAAESPVANSSNGGPFSSAHHHNDSTLSPTVGKSNVPTGYIYKRLTIKMMLSQYSNTSEWLYKGLYMFRVNDTYIIYLL